MKKQQIQASVKDERLVEKRRDEMIKGAVSLFKKKGFHRTTTREIARESGFSIGTLYEYIRKKEDILYLVCDSIYDRVHTKFEQHKMDLEHGTLEGLKQGIRNYFRVVDELQDEFLVMYQESKSLTKETLPYVLQKEKEMALLLEKMLTRCVENGELFLSKEQVQLLSHNIVVLGQMWGFRRWVIQKMFTLDEYIDMQIDFLFNGILRNKNSENLEN